MFGWSVVFLVGALLAALFAFGAVATPHQSAAEFVFYGLTILTMLTFVAGFFVRGGGGHGHGGHGGHHGSDNVMLSSSGRTMAICAILTGAGFVSYLWVTEGWTPNQIASAMSERAAQLADNH